MDDGVGMDEETAARALLGRQEGNRGSIGLSNIHRRIRLRYGEGYGLQIFSQPGEGTTVRVTLPAQEEG